jgi:hypothetical protein
VFLRTLVPLGAAVALAACSSGAKEPKDKDIGAQAADVASDTDALRAANAAAGEVVRAAGDCKTVKTVLPEAQDRLDEIEGSVRTATGRTTLAALRKRVNEIAELCP